MILVLDGNSSQDFWRLVYPAHRKPGYNGIALTSDLAEMDWAFREDDAWALAPRWLNESFLAAGSNRLGCLARDQQLRRSSKTHCVSVRSGTIPEGSFYDLGNGVFVSTPCFTFLQMATQLDLIELIAYGYELCGRYAFDLSSPRGMRKRETPLCTRQQISNYLETARGCYGYGPAQRALQFVLDDSASPMETLDAMLLCLPYRLGGYCLPTPTMNLEIPLDQHARIIARRDSCRADMCYPQIFLDVEHQGTFDHLGESPFDSDRARINGLKAMGFEVIELTAGQVGDLFGLEEIAVYIAKRLKKRIRKSGLGATPARMRLRNTLFAWNRRYGHPK